MIVTNTTRLKTLKNIFQFEWTFEKYCILIKKRKNQDRVILGAFNQKELYFYLLIYSVSITSKSILNDCNKYNKVENIEKYISIWVNIWKVLHPNQKTEKSGSCNFGCVQSKRAIFLSFNIQCFHNF